MPPILTPTSSGGGGGGVTAPEVQALVDASVAALVDSSPGALDTLNELAAALGDDPNFATTVTNALAAKVAKSTLDANTILYATTDDTPAALTVAASRIVGRKATGDIDDLTAAEVSAIIAAAIAADSSLTAAFAPLAVTVEAQTGTTYTPDAADPQKLITLSNASAITVALPQDSDVTLAVGTQIHFAQIGAGQVTFAAGTGATVNSTPGLKCRAQYSTVTAIKRAANTWLLVGDLSA